MEIKVLRLAILVLTPASIPRLAPEMEATWVAIVASLLMATGGVCVFIFCVKRDYFRDLEDAKYHVFWSDLEETVDKSTEQVQLEKDDDDSKDD